MKYLWLLGACVVLALPACGSGSSGPADSDTGVLDGDSAPEGEVDTEKDTEAEAAESDAESADAESADAESSEAESSDSTEASDTESDSEASDTESDSESADSESADSESESGPCAVISVDEVETSDGETIDIGTVLKGQSVTKHVKLCNACRKMLGVDVSADPAFDGACDTLRLSNVVVAGEPYDVSLTTNLVSLLGAELKSGECATFDFTFDTTLSDIRPTRLMCNVGDTLDDGHRYERLGMASTVYSQAMVAESCLSLLNTCAIDNTCYAAGERNPANPCELCVPETTRADWSLAATGAFCDDGNLQTGNGQCGVSGLCEAAEVTTAAPVIMNVAVSNTHACAVSLAGLVYCWGSNTQNALGFPDDQTRSTPTPVPGAPSSVEVAVGRWHSCALTGDGLVYCWGGNSDGQLGRGTTEVSSPVPTAVLGLTQVTKIVSLQEGLCALTSPGQVWCWGYGNNGEIGNGASASVPVPTLVPGITTAVDLAASLSHVCAVLSGGQVMCWGGNENGQLGDGTTTARNLPVPVVGVTTATSVAAGFWHSCALLADHTVRCWGHGRAGELGEGQTDVSTVPPTVLGLNDAIAVYAAGQRSYAVRRDASVVGWGWNEYGELGDGTAGARRYYYSEVFAPGQAPYVLAGGTYFTCAAMQAGGVRCWGQNIAGLFGASAPDTSTVKLDILW